MDDTNEERSLQEIADEMASAGEKTLQDAANELESEEVDAPIQSGMEAVLGTDDTENSVYVYFRGELHKVNAAESDRVSVWIDGKAANGKKSWRKLWSTKRERGSK
jgi:hypothetical protein